MFGVGLSDLRMPDQMASAMRKNHWSNVRRRKQPRWFGWLLLFLLAGGLAIAIYGGS